MSDKELALELTKVTLKNTNLTAMTVMDTYYDIYERVINRESDSKLGKIQAVINECWKDRYKNEWTDFVKYMKKIENIINDIKEGE